MQSSKLYIYGLGGKFIPQAIYMLTNIILARLLSPADFGVIGILAIFFMIAETMMDAGLGGSLINKKNVSKLDCSTVFVFNLTVSHLMYAALFVCADYIESYFGIEGLSTVTRVVSLVFVINSWGLVVSTIITKNLRFKESMILSIVSGIIASIVSIVFALLEFGVYALVAYQLTLALSRVIGSYLIQPMRLSFKFSYKNFKNIAPFGIYTTIVVVIDNIYENILTFLFGKYLNVHQAGYISQSKRIEESASKTLIATINSVAFPVLSKITDENKFVKEAATLYKSICLILFPLLMLVGIYSKEVILILFGREWIDAAPYLSLLIYAGIFMIMESLYRNFIKSLGMVRQLMVYTIYKRVIGFILIFIALTYSIELVLYSYVISAGIAFLLNLFLYCRLIKGDLFHILLKSCSYVLPSLFFLIIIITIENYTNCILYLSLSVSAILLTVYYLFILPKFYNLNIVKFVCGFHKIK